MSTRRSSSSSSQASAGTATLTTAPVARTLKPLVEPSFTNSGPDYTYDSCTYYKKNPAPYEFGKGCYLFRSCQSCLEIEGCLVNDFGVCVEARRGIYNLQRLLYEYNYGYYPPMNYLKAINQSLALPAAASTNPTALSIEQNWHFRAGEATYCSASDATCQECKQKNFWRGDDASDLPDSRFCVGQNGCVCIQTCEMPVYKAPGCQWKLSSPPSSSYNNGDEYYNYYPKEQLTWWNWLLIVAIVVVVHFVFKCCGRSAARKRNIKEAREEAVRAVQRELGIPPEDFLPQSTVVRAVPHPLQRSQTVMSDTDYEDSYKADDTAFVEVVDTTSQPSRTVNGVQ